MADGIQVEDGKVKIALGKFAVALKHKAELLKVLGQRQKDSVQLTFREQGSPSDSWTPLAPSTLAKKGSKGTAGRKILILSGDLYRSITWKVFKNSVVIGTNLVYGRVQQEGSGDRPTPAHTRKFLRAMHYGTREIIKDGKTHHVPVGITHGRHKTFDKSGHKTTVKAKFQGPRLAPQDVSVREHAGGIPARPYLIFRPGDPQMLYDEVQAFVGRCKVQAGLGDAGAKA